MLLKGMIDKKHSKPPFANSYWLEPGRIVCGEYPRDFDDLEDHEGMSALLSAGDVNYDPFVKARQPEAEKVPFHLCDHYLIPNPGGEWSYLAHSGKGFKIDHVMHTPKVEVTSVEYIDWIRGRFLAGEKIKKPISDHAVLRFQVSTNR